MNLGEILKDVAPTLATALIGPLGGAAIEFIAGKLGTDKTVEAVQNKLSGFTAEQLVRMKELDVQFQEFMAANSIALNLGEQEINKIEAASTNWFISGWRPFLGWIGGVGIAYQFVVRPIFNGFIFSLGGQYNFQTLDMQDLVALVTLLLGHVASRSYDKAKGTTNGA